MGTTGTMGTASPSLYWFVGDIIHAELGNDAVHFSQGLTPPTFWSAHRFCRRPS